jgi:hypothetical protein
MYFYVLIDIRVTSLYIADASKHAFSFVKIYCCTVMMVQVVLVPVLVYMQMHFFSSFSFCCG